MEKSEETTMLTGGSACEVMEGLRSHKVNDILEYEFRRERVV